MTAQEVVDMNTNRIGFRAELETLINKHNKENSSGTPDFILADYMADCLEAYDKAMARRTEWYRPTPMDIFYKDGETG
jgi:hypothetical protein